MKRRMLGVAVAFALAGGAPVQGATIVGAAMEAGTFTDLLAAAKLAGVDKALMGQGPFTLFAPDDAAFDKLPQAERDSLMLPENLTMLKMTLGAHLLTGVLSMQAIEAGLADNDAVVATTVNNMPLIFKREGDQITVNGAHMQPPMEVDNGLIYVIDAVLVPPTPLQPTY